MLHKTLKPSQVNKTVSWSGVFANPGMASAAAALTHCLTKLGDSFELWFTAKDLREVAGATIRIDSMQPFLDREFSNGWHYRVSSDFLQFVYANSEKLRRAA